MTLNLTGEALIKTIRRATELLDTGEFGIMFDGTWVVALGPKNRRTVGVVEEGGTAFYHKDTWEGIVMNCQYLVHDHFIDEVVKYLPENDRIRGESDEYNRMSKLRRRKVLRAQA